MTIRVGKAFWYSWLKMRKAKDGEFDKVHSVAVGEQADELWYGNVGRADFGGYGGWCWGGGGVQFVEFLELETR